MAGHTCRCGRLSAGAGRKNSTCEPRAGIESGPNRQADTGKLEFGRPVGTVGTLVNTLVDFAVPAGQLDNVTDVDAGAKLGIAVVAADTSNGSWWYSINNGTTWSGLGSVAVNKARHLAADANTRIYFRPNANFYGNLDSTYYLTIGAIQFHAWDLTRGTNGALTGINNIGGNAAYSVLSDTASLMVKWVPPTGTPQYQLTWIDAANTYPYGSAPSDINNDGVVVGRVRYLLADGTKGSSAYRWSPPDELENLTH